MATKKINKALISVFDKSGLDNIIKLLHDQGVEMISTGGTASFIEKAGLPVTQVESITDYPSILGGRVKTLHPKIFGGILSRRELDSDVAEVAAYDIPGIDLVIVDLYPFENTVASGAPEQDIIEKIDIGGISLIRAAAKNFKDVTIVASMEQYGDLEQLLQEKGGNTELADRKRFAAHAFNVSSHYDTAIFNYFNEEMAIPTLKVSEQKGKQLRYGENPHQEGTFYGDIEALFDQIHGKELSYNNLVDVDAAVGLIDEFKDETAVTILKHNNACGIAMGDNPKDAYLKALQADPLSAFGGVIAFTKEVDAAAAEELHKLFFEILLAPSFSEEALTILKQKKNRILLIRKETALPKKQIKTLLNGYIEQDKDLVMEGRTDLKTVTKRQPSESELKALLFAARVCKHSKSNTIILANDNQLFASGVGQTSRVDALKQAIEKAKSFNFDLSKAVMASDAFFPFPDCVEVAFNEGVKAVVQPGGSVKDQLSIDFCDANDVAMSFTGIRHFKH